MEQPHSTSKLQCCQKLKDLSIHKMHLYKTCLIGCWQARKMHLKLVDIFDSPTRHNRSSSLSGKQIVDYMFVPSELVPAIQKSEYNKFDQILTTDHIEGCMLTLTQKCYLGTVTSN
eukprot:6808552-Ditylum_brightwellii.AAC.1